MDVILDTETTGLQDHDQILEIAIIDAETGVVLLDQRIKPTVSTHPDALAVHGITAEALKDTPAWPEYHDQVCRLLVDADRVMVYNAGFDIRMLEQTARAFGRLIPPGIAWLDLMEPYAGVFHTKPPNFLRPPSNPCQLGVSEAKLIFKIANANLITL